MLIIDIYPRKLSNLTQKSRLTEDQIKKDRDTSLDDITLDYKSLEFHFPYEMALDEQKSVNQSWQNLGNDIAAFGK